MVSKLRRLKSSESGIAHLALLIVIIAAVSAVGFVGYSVWQKNYSSAATARSSCTKAGGVYYYDKNIKGHGPCWKTSGAYLVNYGKGKTGDGIDQVKSGQSERMNYPDVVIVVSGSWKICKDAAYATDECSKTLKRGVHNPCDGGKYFCQYNSVYIKRT